MDAVASSMRGQKIRSPGGASDAVTPSVPRPQISRHPTFSSIQRHQYPSSIVSSHHTQWPPTSVSFPPARALRRAGLAPPTMRPPTLRTRPLSAASWSSVYVSFHHFDLESHHKELTVFVFFFFRPVLRSFTPASESSSFLRKSHAIRIHQCSWSTVLTVCSM